MTLPQTMVGNELGGKALALVHHSPPSPREGEEEEEREVAGWPNAKAVIALV